MARTAPYPPPPPAMTPLAIGRVRAGRGEMAQISRAADRQRIDRSEENPGHCHLGHDRPEGRSTPAVDRLNRVPSVTEANVVVSRPGGIARPVMSPLIRPMFLRYRTSALKSDAATVDLDRSSYQFRVVAWQKS